VLAADIAPALHGTQNDSGTIEGLEAEVFCHWILDEVSKMRGKSSSDTEGHAHTEEDIVAESKLLLEEIDHDGSGELSFEEFKSHWYRLEKQLERMRIARERSRAGRR